MTSTNSLKQGDLIAFSGWNLSGLVINLGTFGIPFYGFSHIGIVAAWNGNLRLFESTTLCKQPCLIQNSQVSGAQCHDIDTRISGYRGIIWKISLRIPLRIWQKGALAAYLHRDVGRSYDMLGAERSGGFLWQAFNRFLRPEDLNNLFCSEWVAASLRSIDVFRTANASAFNPNYLYRELRRRNIVLRCERLRSETPDRPETKTMLQ